MSNREDPEEQKDILHNIIQKAILDDIMERNKKKTFPRNRPVSHHQVAPSLPTRPQGRVLVRPSNVQVVSQSSSITQYTFTDEVDSLPNYQPEFSRSHAQEQEPVSPWFSTPNRAHVGIPTRPAVRQIDDDYDDEHLLSGARLLSSLLVSERKERINDQAGYMTNDQYRQAMQDALEASFRASRPRNLKAKQETVRNIMSTQIKANKKFCKLKHTCTICQCDYEENDKVVTTTCGHHFHFDCMTNAMNHNNKCPNCRTNLDKNQIR